LSAPETPPDRGKFQVAVVFAVAVPMGPQIYPDAKVPKDTYSVQKTGSFSNGCRAGNDPLMPWTSKFQRPIVLNDGRQIATLLRKVTCWVWAYCQGREYYQ
jgi:hypothetical protein